MAHPLDDRSRTLINLGFSETEALVYCQLLQSPGATGYGVAQAIGKSQANVYSALSTLSAKGAVLCEKGPAKLYSCVPPQELLPRLKSGFEQSCLAAANALAEIHGPREGAAIYQLQNPDQVYERAAAMCVGASVSVAFELFHRPFERLKDVLRGAIDRGMGVAGVTFQIGDILDGANCVVSLKGSRTKRWPGDQLTLVTDAREALVALFDFDSGAVLHAFYSDSAYLSCLLHAAVVDATILNMDGQAMLRESLNKRLFGAIPPGFLDLLRERSPGGGINGAGADLLLDSSR